MLHEVYMKRCLELAGKGEGLTAPNPLVGAVLVHDGRIIGEGWHRAYGQAHAEVDCIERVLPEHRPLIPESTMYVNLEPCAHQGNTPPCAVRIVQEKIKKVVICNRDPFHEVDGRGMDMLRRNGVEVHTGVLDEHGRWLNRRFFCLHLQRRPYVILKWAESREGFFAPAGRARTQLSNRHSMQLVHRWRTAEKAVMVGYNTALHDDPRLTARLWEGGQPLRIVTDRQLRLPRSLNLFNDDAPTWILNEVKEASDGNISLVQLPFDDRLLHALMERMHEAGKISLIVEGGASLLRSFINCGLWDEARVFRTAASLAEGIVSPVPGNSRHILQAALESDRLDIYVNRPAGHAYPPGMAL